ncbi:hypothetical protein QZH41_008380 [Actinostola sp. cb2023]|nr:hypothetical protein QZH41_008380 [Actinostola sp. cb2023]
MEDFFGLHIKASSLYNHEEPLPEVRRQLLCSGHPYLVEKEYRYKGYGMELFQAAKLKSVSSPSQNRVGYGVQNMLEKYEKRGAESQWLTSRFDIHLPSAFKALDQVPTSPLYRAQTIDKVDPQALSDYDTVVFGYQRHTFLHKFLRTQGSHARVAINSKGVIVGYTAARVAFNKEEGYRLGPLYADSLEIAMMLLKALFGEMLEEGWSSSPSVWVDIPVGKNTEAKKLIELLDGKVVFNMTLMATKEIQKGSFKNWFAIMSPEFG